MNTNTFYKMPFDTNFDAFDYTLRNMNDKSTYCLNTCLENTKFAATTFTKTQSDNDDYHKNRLKNISDNDNTNLKNISDKFSQNEIVNRQINVTPDIVHIETPTETDNNYRYNKKYYK